MKIWEKELYHFLCGFGTILYVKVDYLDIDTTGAVL